MLASTSIIIQPCLTPKSNRAHLGELLYHLLHVALIHEGVHVGRLLHFPRGGRNDNEMLNFWQQSDRVDVDQ